MLFQPTEHPPPRIFQWGQGQFLWRQLEEVQVPFLGGVFAPLSTTDLSLEALVA